MLATKRDIYTHTCMKYGFKRHLGSTAVLEFVLIVLDVVTKEFLIRAHFAA
jgi:hypothetical protein